MPAIEQDFNLKVNLGPLDRFVSRMKESVETSDRQTSAIDRIAAAAQSAGGAMAGFVSGQVSLNREFYASEAAARKVSDATNDLVSQLAPLQEAFNSAFTDSQRDKAMDNLIRKMEQVGLVFTSEAAEIASADTLSRNSLEDLARSGDIAANSLAEIRYEDKISKSSGKSESALKKIGRAAKSAASSMCGLGKTGNPLDGLTGKLTRMVATLFTARKLMQYIRNAIERAPDAIAGSFNALKSGVSDGFTRAIVSMMSGMQGGVDKLNASMNSASGQKFFRGLETAAAVAGRVVGKALELIGAAIEFVGEHAEVVFTIAAIAVGFFAAKMLLAAAATAAANWPIILMIGLVAAVVAALMKADVTAEDIFRGIGAGIGVLYAFIYNIVADIYNVLASFAEFVANFMDDPLAAIARLVIDLADTVLSMIESIGGAIGRLLGKDWSSGIHDLRDKLQNWADDTYGEKKITIDRMDKKDYVDTAADWAEKGASFGASLSDFSLSQAVAQPIKAIKSDTSAIKKAVDMTKEDLKSLVDLAERRYINRINLTSQTPIITINGANTGKTAQDRQALAEAIKEVLIEQTAGGAVVATAIP